MTLSSRERVLAIGMGGIVFVLLNLLLITAFSRKNIAMRAQLAEKKMEWSAMQDLLGEEGKWASRDAALTANQPKLSNENAAGVELLDLIQSMAKKHDVSLENKLLGGVEKSTDYRAIPVTLDTHSSWPNLISFLYTLQKPDQFVVFETASVQVDPADATKMVGHFKIARWYAP